jgi:hypothetical protein
MKPDEQLKDEPASMRKAIHVRISGGNKNKRKERDRLGRLRFFYISMFQTNQYIVLLLQTYTAVPFWSAENAGQTGFAEDYGEEKIKKMRPVSWVVIKSGGGTIKHRPSL